MTYKYLDVITTKENTIEREGVIAIDTQVPNNPMLVIFNNGKWNILNNYNSLSGMAKLDDLYTILYEKDWGIGGRLFRVGKDELYFTPKNYFDIIPTLTFDDKSMICISEVTEKASRDEFENLYTKSLNMETITEIDLLNNYHRYIVSSRNLINSSSTIDLLSLSENSTDYTNILNLNELLEKEGNKFVMENYSIGLDVIYTKDNYKQSGKLIFEPFSVDNKGNLTYYTFNGNINNDVNVEVKNGCIRLFPVNDKVTECLIYHCYLIYGKLL